MGLKIFIHQIKSPVAKKSYVNNRLYTAGTLVFIRATPASAGRPISCRRVSVCPSVCYKLVFYWNR